MPDPAPPAVLLIPLAEIDAQALIRDRAAVDAEAMAELQSSILNHGLRQPVEVYAIADPVTHASGVTPLYALISGHRRLTALANLHKLTAFDRFAAIPAFLRQPASIAEALIAMVEENDVRAEISPWEKGRIAAEARERGFFPTTEDAVDKLYPAASRQKRSRLRQIAELVDDLGNLIAAPEALSLRQTLRLADACRLGYTDVLRATLGANRHNDVAQWPLIEAVLAEAEATRRAHPDPRPGRPRRTSNPRPALVIHRERTRTGWSLHFSGRGATCSIMSDVFDEIDRIFTPG